ncbi:MAG: hypothetical protein C5B59_10655 [Bacteroidetes bacterium]|nr:MAG: hypothetical protein C5B59_10655 [Bacteroidota bacterium]
MRNKKPALIAITLFTSVILAGFAIVGDPDIPRLWDLQKYKSGYMPLADRSVDIQQISEELYYKIPERVGYKTYPFYLPGREPKGYYAWLLGQQPEIVFNISNIKSEADWVKAGEMIYELPMVTQSFMDSAGDMKTLQQWGDLLRSIHAPVAKDGIIPFLQLVVTQKGKISLGLFACAECHNRVMPDSSVLKGGQGNFPFDHWWGKTIKNNIEQYNLNDSSARDYQIGIFRYLYSAAWVRNEDQAFMEKPEPSKAISIFMATVPGVMHRHGSSLGAPTAIPDLFNLQERKYLDHTGAALNRDISDMMRYEAQNQEMEHTNSYGGFKPDPRPDSIILQSYTRFSDAQAYALAKYLYSLKPLANPDKGPRELVARGRIIFEQEECSDCHTPPFYSDNRLTPAAGFTQDKAGKDTFDLCVNTDPKLALYSRRGTGYYKVPSLIGVWNRSALLHGGYVTTLEELFNPARLKNDFMPSGFNPNIDKPFAVKGHNFGLSLDAEDKKALMAFLRSL